MKAQKLILICRYSTDEQSIAQIIQSSFDVFLKKELQNITRYPHSIA